MSDFKGKIAIFPTKEKQSEKSPDHSGAIELTTSDAKELQRYLASAQPEEDYQGNLVVKLRVATWVNEMKDGRKYIKGLVSAPSESAAPAPAPVNSAEVPF